MPDKKAVIDMTFYETLSYVLEEKGISPAEISAKTGINQSYFSKLKSGHMKDVTWDKALKIIAALEMTPNEFQEVSYYLMKIGGDDDES